MSYAPPPGPPPNFPSPAGPPPTSAAPPGGFAPPLPPQQLVQHAPTVPTPYGAPYGAPGFPSVSAPPLVPVAPTASIMRQAWYLGVPVYTGVPPVDNSLDPFINALEKALKDGDTDDIIAGLVPKTAQEMQVLDTTFEQKKHKDIRDRIGDLTSGKKLFGGLSPGSGNFKDTLKFLSRGPLGGDAWLFKYAIELEQEEIDKTTDILLDLFIGRPAEEIEILRQYIRSKEQKNIDTLVQNKLTPSLKPLFRLAMASPATAPRDYSIEQDLASLRNLLGDPKASDEALSEIILSRPPDYRLQLSFQWIATGNLNPISKDIKKHYSEQPGKALISKVLVYGARTTESPDGNSPGTALEAKRILATMKGGGTRDTLLYTRIIRSHWNNPRFASVVAAYKNKKKTSEKLVERVKSETAGDYEKLLLNIIDYASRRR